MKGIKEIARGERHCPSLPNLERPEKESILAGEQGWFYEENTYLLYVALGNTPVDQKKVVKIKGVVPPQPSKELKVHYYGTNWSQVSIHYGLKRQAGPWKIIFFPESYMSTRDRPYLDEMLQQLRKSKKGI